MEVKINFCKKRRFADMGGWRQHFENNRESRPPIFWDDVQIEAAQRKALVRSLQRFQVGKSREGVHIKRWAALTGNADYARSIELLMAEQHEHARMLALLLEKFNAPLLRSHWSDSGFILLRRFAGLETEILTVLVAEVIAQRYFQVLRRNTDNAALQTFYSRLLEDGEAHIAFHCDYLRDTFQSRTGSQSNLKLVLWRCLFRAVVTLFAFDHRTALLQAKKSPTRFMRECSYLFDKAIVTLTDRKVEPIAIQVLQVTH